MENNIELYEHIMYVTDKEKYKKLDRQIILDAELSKNDLAIYLAILKSVNYDETFTKVTHKNITNITGIAQPNQGKSLNKLQDKGYIYSQLGDNCIEYVLGSASKKYIRLPLSYFSGLKHDVKSYTRKLRYISLSNGNNVLPTKAICNKYTDVSREEYKILKSYESSSDVDIYESLQMTTSNEVKKQSKVIALKQNDPRLEGLTVDQQLDALLGV